MIFPADIKKIMTERTDEAEKMSAIVWGGTQRTHVVMGRVTDVVKRPAAVVAKTPKSD